MNDSCRTYKYVMVHRWSSPVTVWVSHISHRIAVWDMTYSYMGIYFCFSHISHRIAIWDMTFYYMGHDSFIYEWVMSHMSCEWVIHWYMGDDSLRWLVSHIHTGRSGVRRNANGTRLKSHINEPHPIHQWVMSPPHTQVGVVSEGMPVVQVMGQLALDEEVRVWVIPKKGLN